MGRLKGKFRQEAMRLLGLLATMPSDVTNPQLVIGLNQLQGRGGERQVIRYLQYLQTQGNIRIHRHRHRLPNGNWANRRRIEIVQTERTTNGHTEDQIGGKERDAPRLEALRDGAAHYVTGEPTGW